MVALLHHRHRPSGSEAAPMVYVIRPSCLGGETQYAQRLPATRFIELDLPTIIFPLAVNHEVESSILLGFIRNEYICAPNFKRSKMHGDISIG